MTAATVEKRIETFQPGIDIVRLTVSDGNTYSSGKLHIVEAAQLTVNEDTDSLSPNVTNSDGNPIDGTDKTVKINLASGTNQTCTLTLYGKQ